MELLNTLISGISVGSTLCGALATLTGTNTVRPPPSARWVVPSAAPRFSPTGSAAAYPRWPEAFSAPERRCVRMFTLLTAATAAVVSTTPPVGGLLLAAIGLKALSDAAEISRDAREHDSDRR